MSTQSSRVRLASAAYPVDFLGQRAAWVDKITRWVEQAAAAGAGLLVFPEYAAMELASLFGREIYSSLAGQLEALQSVAEDYRAVHAALAHKHGLYIVAGSFPIAVGTQRYHNRAYVFTPSGQHDFQDKIQMTRFENERWLISSGEELKVFSTTFGKFAVNLCYDAEFPLLTRAQVAAGADLVVVPSCTDTVAGFERVRLGCRARALENQCFVSQSSLVGEAAWSEAVDINCGAAGVYAPVDYGYPDDGVLQQGPIDQPGWIYQDLDLARLAEVRDAGQVFNFRDWDRHTHFNPIEVVV